MSTKTEPESDYYRGRLRQIVHCCEHYEETTTFADILKLAKEALRRPRSNDAVIDGLEKTVGDLRSELIDVDVLRLEKRHAESVAKQTTEFANAVEKELAQLRAKNRFGRIGQRLDAWFLELESYRRPKQ